MRGQFGTLHNHELGVLHRSGRMVLTD